MTTLGWEGAATVRDAIPADATVATRIAKAAKASWGYPQDWLAEWDPHLTISPSDLEWHDGFMAGLGSREVGVALLTRTGNIFELAHLWVLPDAQGAGVGSRLVEAVRNRAAERGATALRIESDPNAVSFYERMGARVVGTVQAPVCGQDRTLPVMALQIRRGATAGDALP